jgi:hypothetical protein
VSCPSLFAFPTLDTPAASWRTWPGIAIWQEDYPDPDDPGPDALWFEWVANGPERHRARIAWARSGRCIGDVRWGFSTADERLVVRDLQIEIEDGKGEHGIDEVTGILAWSQEQSQRLPCALSFDPQMWKGIREDAATDGAARHLAMLISDWQSNLLGSQDTSLVDHRAPWMPRPVEASEHGPKKRWPWWPFGRKRIAR